MAAIVVILYLLLLVNGSMSITMNFQTVQELKN